MEHTTNDRYIQWPPKVIQETPLGVHRDSNSNYYPRDIGRSSALPNGDIIWQFGDTFSHDDAKNFTGLASNTYSVTSDPYNPTLSVYRHRDPESKDPVEIFIRLDDSELQQGLKAWSFSGIVPLAVSPEEQQRPGSGGKEIEGWTFFEVVEEPQGGQTKYLYTGVGKVCYNIQSKTATFTRKTGTNGDKMLFNAPEPRFGSLCAVLGDKNYIYLYGPIDDNNKNIHVARVPASQASVREGYEFWTGREWSDDVTKAATVMYDMQHGQVFRSRMFGTSSEYDWVFIGCNAQGDSKVQMGRAKSPEGPWHIYDIGIELYILRDSLPTEFTYCVYPHPWADRTQDKGDLTISWSEGGMTGRVLMSKIRFYTKPA